MSPGGEGARGLSGIAKLFEQSRPPITELPAFRIILEEFAAACSVAFRGIAHASLTVVLKQVERSPLNKAMISNRGAVCSLFLVPEWNAQGIVGFAKPMLLRLLDLMYGGDDNYRAKGPERGLTQLERNIAGQIAIAILDQLRVLLEPHVVFGLRLVSVDELADASMYEKNATEFAIFHLWIVELDEMIIVGLPLIGLELARDQLTSVSDEAGQDIDPNWRRLFNQSVGSTQVEFVASCDGPPMLLRDVAQLRVGSVVEFDAEYLQRVCLDVAGDRVFQGRLGQSKGYFTICLETPLAGSA